MQRVKRLLLILGFLILSVFAWAAVVHAQSFRSGSEVTVPANKTINSTLFAAGNTIDIAGTVNGDVFCAGANVTVSGRVHGDVICAGQNLTINGQVSGDVRLAGQNVVLSSQVDGSATVVAQSFAQQAKSVVRRDMSVGSTDTTVNGKVGRDLASGATTLNVDGTIGRNLQADVQHLHLLGNAKISGNVTYTSANKLSKSNGATVNGTITHKQPMQRQNHGGVHLNSWLVALYFYVSFILVAVVLALVMPELFERGVVVAREHMGTTFLIGLVGSIVTPIVLALAMATIIGIPLALLAGLIWLVALLLSGPFAAYLLGKRIVSSKVNSWLAMLVGSAILFLLYMLPFIGIFVWLVATWFGLGVILRLLSNVGRSYHDPSTVTPPVVTAASTDSKPE